MAGRYGVIAEGFVSGKWVSSRGKAGVDGDGGLKAHACATWESAVYRALRSCSNQARFAHGDGGWVEFPSLSKATQDELIRLMASSLDLVEVEPGLYRAAFCEASFRTALGEVVG